MSEPFSVVAASISLAQLCLTAVASIYALFSKANSVDRTLSSLADQVNLLATVLKSISETYTSTETTRQGHPALENHWAHVRVAMKDCEQTLNNLENLLKEIRFENGRFFRRARTQVGMEIQTSQIKSYNETIGAFCRTMQISFQLLNLYTFNI